MNKLDLTKTGGFPFTQDMLDWIQQNSLAVMNMLGAKLLPDSLANTANTPVGLVGINPNGGSIYKAGYLWYNNEILHFPTDIDMSGMPALTGGLVYGFAIQETDTPVSYFDGTSHNTKISRTVTIAAGANTLTATFIPLTTTIYYFDNGLREITESHQSLSGNVTGEIYYRKNYLNNTMQIRGVINVIVANIPGTSTPPNPLSGYTIGSALPVGYRPASAPIYWQGNIIYQNTTLKDSTGADFMRSVLLTLDTSGQLAYWPILAASDYSLYFNLIVSLD